MEEAIGDLATAIDKLAAALDRRADVEEKRLAALTPAVPASPRRSVPDIVLDAVKALGGRAGYSEVEAYTGRSFSSVYNGLERLRYDGKLRKIGKRGSYVWEIV